MDAVIVLIVVVIILAILIVLLIAYNAQVSSQKIDPNQCPVAAGDFGVQTGKYGAASQLCSGPCTWNGIPDLTTAIAKCNSLANICSVFAYSPSAGVMQIIDPNTVLTTGSYDLYTRQYPTVVQ